MKLPLAVIGEYEVVISFFVVGLFVHLTVSLVDVLVLEVGLISETFEHEKCTDVNFRNEE